MAHYRNKIPVYTRNRRRDTSLKHFTHTTKGKLRRKCRETTKTKTFEKAKQKFKKRLSATRHARRVYSPSSFHAKKMQLNLFFEDFSFFSKKKKKDKVFQTNKKSQRIRRTR
jgi:hypothetical protein